MNEPIEHKVKYRPLKCYYCPKVFTPKQVMGSITLEEQAKCEEEFIAHLDWHYWRYIDSKKNYGGEIKK